MKGEELRLLVFYYIKKQLVFHEQDTGEGSRIQTTGVS